MNLYADERGYDLANATARKLGSAHAEIKGLKRVIRQLGQVLKQLDPNNEHLTMEKFNETYKDTNLEIPSPFK